MRINYQFVICISSCYFHFLIILSEHGSVVSPSCSLVFGAAVKKLLSLFVRVFMEIEDVGYQMGGMFCSSRMDLGFSFKGLDSS